MLTLIPMLLSAQLREALALDNLTPSTYGPAYGGESVGLDLYNAGPKIIIPPAEKLLKYLYPEELRELGNPPSWLDIPERLRKGLFKKLMPTGVRTVIPHGYVGIIKERGSITKSPFVSRAGVIDPGYSGEIFVNMVNISPVRIIIPEGAKSPFQLIIVASTNNYTPVNEEAFLEMHADNLRKSKMIGSSD